MEDSAKQGDTKPRIDRREALGLIVAGAGAVAAGGLVVAAPGSGAARAPGSGKMPALFLAHGSPMLLDDHEWMAELKSWADRLPRPKAVLMLSAHWEERPFTLGATRTAPLIYDFYGFPEHYYRQQYPAPGAPELAERVRHLVGAHQPVAEDPRRGLDHGAYVPMVAMYPEANVPVLQASLPTMDPRELFKLGQALAPLRDEGVLIIGSGFLAHNLRAAMWGSPDPRPPAWAAEFDAWNAEVLAKKDVDALLDYRARAPGVRLALPTHEHFVPVIVALGAAADSGPVSFPITGYLAGVLTKRSVQFG